MTTAQWADADAGAVRVGRLVPAGHARPVPPGDVDETCARARAAAHAQGLREGLEEGRARGLEQGHAEGWAIGRQEALAAAERAASSAAQAQSEALSAWTQAVAALQALRPALLQEAERELALVAAEVLARLVGEALVQPASLVARVGRLVRSLPVAATAVRLHPAMLAHIDQADGAGWRWVADPTLGPGDCMVETAGGSLDARLEVVLQDCLRSVHAAWLASDADARQAAAVRDGAAAADRAEAVPC